MDSMQFKVPQFIDIEDKVFGPLTFKQFAYLAGGIGFAYLSFHYLPIAIAIFLGPAIAGFAAALAFMKYNQEPFIHVVESFIKYYSRSRLYLWHKSEVPPGRATLTGSNLKTLSWNVDIIDPKK